LSHGGRARGSRGHLQGVWKVGAGAGNSQRLTGSQPVVLHSERLGMVATPVIPALRRLR
jgi:hypothetical protein